MRSNFIRSLAAFILIAISVVSLLPPAPALGGQQSSPEARPRRGKNDSSTGPAAKPNQAVTAQQGDSDEPQTEVQTPARDARPAKATSTEQKSSDVDSQQRDPDSSLQEKDSQRTSQRRDVPAFDRPALGSGPQSQASQAPQEPARRKPQLSTNDDRSGARTTPDTRGQQSPPQTSGASSRNGSGVDIDDPRAERGTQQRPTLRRPSDPPPEANRQSQRGDASLPSGRTTQREQSEPRPGGADEAIKLESTLINLPLLVSDRSGRYIPQLTKNDFLLLEDGVRQQVASFGSEEVPFTVALLLDVSPSVADNIPNIQDAAIAFVRQLRAHDRVMVVSFDKRAQFLTDFTSDRRMLESAIRSISTGSGTSVYDAVYETVAQRLRSVEGRKALILFSDGEDTTSRRATYDDAVNIVTESDVLVYGLRYPGSGNGGNMRNRWPRFPDPQTQIPFPLPFPWPFPQRRRRGPLTPDPNADPSGNPQSSRRGSRGGDFMTDITAAGGGPVFDAEQVGDMTRLAIRIADELRHVYVLSYYPSNPLSNGGYRSIRVSVKGRDDIAVRHRRGYNARDARSNRPTT
ncbi:MAG: VWA domain-containing protein [Acidobacteriota bacterium]